MLRAPPVAGLTLVVLAGCTDSSLEIRVSIPASYDADVAYSEVELFSADGSDPFTCDDLAFGDVSTERQSQASLGTFRIGGGAGTAGSVVRAGRKLAVARGFDATGVEVVTGCTAIDVVDSTPVEIATLPVATIHVVEPAAPPMFVFVAVDSMQHPIADRTARWALYQPGPDSNGEATTDTTGQSTITIDPSNLAGPTLLDIDAMWSDGVHAQMRGNRLANEQTFSFSPLPNATDPADVVAIGIDRFRNGWVAWFEPATTTLTLARYVPTLRALVKGPPIPLSGTPAFVKLRALRMQSGGDVAMVVTDRGFYVLDPIMGLGTERPWPSGLTLPIETAAFGPCDGSKDESLLLEHQGTLVAFDTTGTAVATFAMPPSTKPLRTSGCVASDAGIRRVVVFASGADPRHVDLLAPDSGETATVDAETVGFTPSYGTIAHELVSTDPGIFGFTMHQQTLSSPLGTVDVDVQALLGPVYSLVGFDLDHEGVSVAAAIPIDPDAGSWQLVTYGPDRFDGQAVYGVSEPIFDIHDPRLFAVDVDNDGYDDLIVAAADGVKLFRMGPQ